MKLLKKNIKEFSRHNYSGIEKRTKEVHDDLCKAQLNMLSHPTHTNAAAEIEATRKWVILSTTEEGFLLQRSRVQWSGLGNSNTTFYHRMVASCRAQNHIHFLVDESGSRIDTQVGIQNHCIYYFSNLLGNEVAPPSFEQADLNLMFNFECTAEEKTSFGRKFIAA